MRSTLVLWLLLLGIAAPAGAALLPAGTPLTARFAEGLVSAALKATGAGEQFHIILDQPLLPLGNAATLATDVALEEFQYDPIAGRFHGTLVGTFEGRERFRLPIFGRAQPVILAPALKPDEPITVADLSWVQCARTNMPLAGRTDADQIVAIPSRCVEATARASANHG